VRLTKHPEDFLQRRPAPPKAGLTLLKRLRGLSVQQAGSYRTVHHLPAILLLPDAWLRNLPASALIRFLKTGQAPS